MNDRPVKQASRMPRRGRGWAVAATLAAVAGGAAMVAPWLGGRRAKAEGVPLVRVQRTDLELTLVTGGEIEGGKSTIVECELQNLPGPDGRPSAGMTLIELIDDGTRVRKGDVLCRFDSSNYEELVRRQKIEVERSTSEERQAALEREAAEAALVAYRDGESVQITEELESKIALAQADLRRSIERLTWAERMLKVGYVSSDEVAQARRARGQQEVDLTNHRRSLFKHTRFTAPKTVRELEVQMEDAARRLEFGGERREAEEGRLAKLEGLIENCTIKAPHDGLVIHANIFYRSRPDTGETFLRAGARIVEGQPLFILPDLTHPIVKLALHESIAADVRVGMPARIQVPALPGRELAGKVQWINPLPTEQWRAFHEYQGFDVNIAIDDPPERLLPSFTAQVTIVTGQRHGVLVVPSSSIAVEDGQPVCYVPGRGGTIERRLVELAPADRDRVQIVSGLSEGDAIVRDPSPFRRRPDSQLDPLPGALVEPAAATLARPA